MPALSTSLGRQGVSASWTRTVPSATGRTGIPDARGLTVCFSGPQQPSSSQPMYYPGIEEDLEVTHQAFHRAFDDAKPIPAKVPGLQQFAASIWDRRRRIPSSQDPLLHIFDEFDGDSDGILSSAEIAEALRSRGVVTITDEQVQTLINCFEESKACALPSFMQVVTRQQWPDFVYSLCVADMHTQKSDAFKSLDSE